MGRLEAFAKCDRGAGPQGDPKQPGFRTQGHRLTEDSLSLLTRRFHDALQDDDDLKLLCLHAALGQVIEGALGVYDVADGERGHEEKLVGSRAEAHVQLQLIERQELALRGLAGLDGQRVERQKEREISAGAAITEAP